MALITDSTADLGAAAPDDLARHQEPALLVADHALCLPVTTNLSGPCTPAAR